MRCRRRGLSVAPMSHRRAPRPRRGVGSVAVALASERLPEACPSEVPFPRHRPAARAAEQRGHPWHGRPRRPGAALRPPAVGPHEIERASSGRVPSGSGCSRPQPGWPSASSNERRPTSAPASSPTPSRCSSATSPSRTRLGSSPPSGELHVLTTLESGLTLRGYVDRLDVTPAGDMRVVDYKTGRSPSPGFEARAMFQMRFYALVLWRIHGRVRGCCTSSPGQRRGPRYQPDEADLLATARSRRSGRPSSAPPDEGDWRPSTSSCATGAPTRTPSAPPGAARLRPLPVSVPAELVAEDPEAPSPHGFGDELV